MNKGGLMARVWRAGRDCRRPRSLGGLWKLMGTSGYWSRGQLSGLEEAAL